MSSLHYLLFIFLTLTFMSGVAKAAPGAHVATTPHFPAFNNQQKSVRMNTNASTVYLEATQDLHLRSCTVHISGAAATTVQVGSLAAGQYETVVLGRIKKVTGVSCFGSSVHPRRIQGQIKVYVLALKPIRPWPPRPPRPMPPRPPRPPIRPIPVPPRPIPVPGPRPPRNVRLPAQNKEICVGKSKKLIQLRNQAAFWTVNGVTSRRSTFWYNGTFSRLTLDVHTANVIAACRREGTETYNLTWKVAFTDPRIYSMAYTVECKPCEEKKKKRAVADAKKKAKALARAAKKNNKPGKKIDKILELLDALEEELNDLLEREDISAEEVEILQTALQLAAGIDEAAMEGFVDGAQILELWSLLNEL